MLLGSQIGVTARPSNVLVDVDAVDVVFGEQTAVGNLSFKVHSSERVAIVGATGAGKSTVLALIGGSLSPTQGTVTIAGKSPSVPGRDLQGKVAVAFQSPRLLPWRSALRNVELGLQIMKVDRSEARERAHSWLARVGLADATHKYPHQLSGGMRQRVSLARALVVEPELVLLDEPFSALDERTSGSLRNDFKTVIQEAGVTSLLVTHNIEEAFEMSERVLVFGESAQILSEYTAGNIDFSDANSVRAARHDIHEHLAEKV